MLTALRIQNFAIVDELEVRFGPGFNAVTGETGAGKSILIDALSLALGGRASAEVVRSGCEEAVVEALFEGVDLADRLVSLGLPSGEGELLVRRVCHRSGRSRVWINGALATVGLLEQACRGLVDVSGQHEHVSLLDAELHLPLLDGWAGLHAEVARYREAFQRLTAAIDERRSLAIDDAERARRIDYLSFQIEEIEKLGPRTGESEELAAERKRLASAGKLRDVTAAAERALYSGEGAAAELVGAALSRLADAASLDPALGPVVAALQAARVEIEEAARTLAAYAKRLEADPARLAEVEERSEALKRLERKHGGSLDTVLRRLEEMKSELAGVERHAERLSAVDRECVERGREAVALAQALSQKRHEAAGAFARAVEKELGRLAMGKTVFRVALAENARAREGGTLVEGRSLGTRGMDSCELLIAPNPGEEPRPLAKVASGGELSRVMLAIKRALAKSDPVPTYVFDEVDSGIGGAVAEVVGRLLKEVSRERQVLCVTHLPQIASCADRHFTVEKREKAGRAVSRIEALDEGARAREIARMLAGLTVTPAALRNAREMLDAAGRKGRRAHR